MVDAGTTWFAPAERRSSEEIRAQWDAVARVPFLGGIMDTVPDAILVLNDCRQIVFANRAFGAIVGSADVRELAGRRPGEAVGCVHAGQREEGCGTTEFCEKCGAVRAILTAQGGVADVQECRITLQGGESLDLQVHATPFDLQGTSYTVFCIVDTSGEKRRRVLERIFFHDVLNTAGGLYGLADLMSDKAPEEERAGHFARTVYSLSKTIVDEIEAQRDLAAAENHDLVLQEQHLNSLKLLEEVAATYQYHEVAHGKTVAVDPASVSRDFVGDRRIVKRVLGNLLKNALEASHQGDCVTVRCLEEGQALVYQVHNPTFMPRDVQLQIFKRSFSTKGVDRGVGTYSIKLLAEKYLGGSVTFKTDEAAGTTFQVWMPPSALVGTGPDAGSAPSSTAAEDSTAPVARDARPARLDGVHILLVEDNDINQQIVVALLGSVGASVDICGNGLEAVEKLTGTASPPPYLAVLMDLQMPELDGYQATERIRLHGHLAALPIVAMTARGSVDEIDRCYAVGMQAHVAKPIDPTSLFETLQRFRHQLEAGGRQAASAVEVPGPVAAAPAPATPEIVLLRVEGLNTSDGILRLAGNAKLYCKLLRQFVTDQGDTPERIRDLVSQGRMGEAEALAHTLKGVSGNIGASHVQSLAGQLEKALASGGEAPEIEAIRLDLASTLATLLSHLGSAMEPSSPPAAAEAVDAAHSEEILAEMRRLLGECDPGAGDCLEAHRETIRAALPAADFEQFEQYVQGYAFDDALALLQRQV